MWFGSLAVALVAVALHLGFARQRRSAPYVVDVVLLYMLVIFVGGSGLMGALGHTFMAREIALRIGWQPDSPFQFEVAMANLAFGILGITCFWLRREFWTATGIGWAAFLLGCAYGHVREMVVRGNDAPYNTGAVLWFGDLLMPLIILSLLWVRRRLGLKAASSGESGR